jgi:hypothetical protein
LVILLQPSLDAVISAGEDDIDGAVVDSGLPQQAGQRRTGPAGRANCLGQPRLADWTR